MIRELIVSCLSLDTELEWVCGLSYCAEMNGGQWLDAAETLTFNLGYAKNPKHKMQQFLYIIQVNKMK